MSERAPINTPITLPEGSHPSRVMAGWMADVNQRLAALEASKTALEARVTALEALHP